MRNLTNFPLFGPLFPNYLRDQLLMKLISGGIRSFTSLAVNRRYRCDRILYDTRVPSLNP